MKIQTVHNIKMPFDKRVRGLNWICNRLTENIENYLIRNNDIVGCIGSNKYNRKIILSMTTYPSREKAVGYTIKSLLNQSIKVDQFIIWLANEQYIDKRVPENLKIYMKYGVEFRFCEDLKSHKKYYYVMKENPNDLIITVDDDVIYPENTVEKLIKKHLEFPNAVICNQARWINFNGENFAPYSTWKTFLPKDINSPNFAILPIGCGGVLYPPNSLPSITFNKQLMKALAPYGDDLWLKFMEVYQGTRAMVSCSHQRGLSDVKTDHKLQKLCNNNVKGGLNDKAIAALSDYFPTLKEKIKKDIR